MIFATVMTSIKKGSNLMEYPHTVVVILEAKPGKVTELKAALMTVAQHSRLENTNIEYRVHESIDNPGQFILYENWVSKEKHQQQFEKPYITELAATLESLLAKPYAAYMANEIK